MTTRTCKICGKKFDFISTWNLWNKQTCSNECRLENARRISEKSREKVRQKIERRCKICGESYKIEMQRMGTGKCKKCIFKEMSQKRRGKGNPAYRNGFAMQGKRTYTGKHLRACAKYRKVFKEKNGYLYCEVCGVNENGTPKFEVHHIYFASLYPKHPELHNPRNLVLVCIGCHNKFHAGKQYHDEFEMLENERGLKELFK